MKSFIGALWIRLNETLLRSRQQPGRPRLPAILWTEGGTGASGRQGSQR